MITVSIKPDNSSSSPVEEAHRQLNESERLRLARQYDKALRICEALLNLYPNYVGALHTAGLIHADKREFPRALDYLVRAAMHHPGAWTTLTALSGVYLALGAPEMAAETLQRVLKIRPDDPGVLTTLGQVYREEREYELAVDAFRRALSLDSGNKSAATGLGICAAQLGLYEEAASSLRRVIATGTFTIQTLYALARLPPGFVGLDEPLKELARAKQSDNETEAEFNRDAAFVRVLMLDRAGRYRDAWDTACAANNAVYHTIKKEALRQHERERRSLAIVHAQPGRIAPEDPSAPISLFILGSSRSGKTTLESVVESFPELKRGYENPLAENAIRRTFQAAGFLSGNSYNALPQGLEPLCRETYLDELHRRAGSAKVFSNTDPTRMHDALRIAAVIPNVRFVFVKRDFDDTILRIFLRRYFAGNVYAYNLGTIREHVTWHHQMMDAIAAKLPAISCVVSYEAMVADPRSIVGSVAKLCGLPLPDAGPLKVGDDRGCGVPYREFMKRM